MATKKLKLIGGMPMSAVDGLEEALANAGGGSASSGWRLLRAITIPEDITTDTSGVAFAEHTNGGVMFKFDTDKNGEPFDCKEIFMYATAGYAYDGTYNYMTIHMNPDNAFGHLMNSFMLYTGSLTVNTQRKLFGHLTFLGDGYYYSEFGFFNGGSQNAVYSPAQLMRAYNNKQESLNSLSVYVAGNGGGFTVGSSFVFFGR